MIEIGWTCDFCNKGGIVVSSNGTLYCPNCKMSYGETIGDMKEILKKAQKCPKEKV